MNSNENEAAAVIECREVTKVYRGTKAGRPASVCALDKVSLRVGGGTIIGLIGPNGAGKTTFLSLIAGLIFPTQGFILYRFLGLSSQAAIHIWLAGALILLLHRLTGHGTVDRFMVWMLAAWLLFNVWTALSTSLSVVVRRSHNSMFLFIITAGVFLVVSFLMNFFPENPGTKAYLAALRYTGPPVELLAKMGLGKSSLFGSAASVGHSLMLTALYGAAGIVLLGRREFKFVAD